MPPLASTRERELRRGDRLDRYELVERIGAGGMGQLWSGRQRGAHGFSALVAIKTILPKLAGEPVFRDMFLDEVRIAARIRHPNVVQVLDVGEQEGLLFLVMEHVDGAPLSRLERSAAARGERIPLAVALRIVADACAGLQAAHELRDERGELLNVIHRDVSPQNILVSAQGAVKLIDFGIARARDRLSPSTRSGMLKGKVSYLAPEQVRGLQFDARVDIWSVGVLLYQLVSGRLPYETDGQIATLAAILDGTASAALPEDVPPDVAAIVRKCLRRDPDERFPTAATLREAILDAMAALSLRAHAEDVAAVFIDFMPEHTVDRAPPSSTTVLDPAVHGHAPPIRIAAEADQSRGKSPSGRKRAALLVVAVGLAVVGSVAVLGQRGGRAATADFVDASAHDAEDGAVTAPTASQAASGSLEATGPTPAFTSATASASRVGAPPSSSRVPLPHVAPRASVRAPVRPAGPTKVDEQSAIDSRK